MIEDMPQYSKRLKFWNAEDIHQHVDEIDFIMTLGGDGTVLFASWLFQRAQVPPIIPFDLGSLGFLTNFDITEVKNVIETIVGCKGDGVRLNMRMRLSCTVWRLKTPSAENGKKATSSRRVSGQLSDGEVDKELLSKLDYTCTTLATSKTKDVISIDTSPVSSEEEVACAYDPVATYDILNDLVIDRGPSPYMSHLELYADNRHLTTVQADGIVIGTPTGSTAYSVCFCSIRKCQ